MVRLATAYLSCRPSGLVVVVIVDIVDMLMYLMVSVVGRLGNQLLLWNRSFLYERRYPSESLEHGCRDAKAIIWRI